MHETFNHKIEEKRFQGLRSRNNQLMGETGHPTQQQTLIPSLADSSSRGNAEELPRDNHQGSERVMFHKEAGYMTADPLFIRRNFCLQNRGSPYMTEG